MHISFVSLGLAAALSLVALAGPARADIKSFNAAMQVKDYKAAAAAAASAWPGLDKSRKDLAVIAREFGFAAYLSGDFAAAKTYGEAASTASRAAAEELALQIGSDLLWRLAEHRISPTGDTRERLFALLQSRLEQPDIDLVSYLSADAIVAYDFDKGLWQQALASAALADRLTADRPGYLETNFRFVLAGAAAAYMAERNMVTHEAFGDLQKRLVSVIAGAPPEQDMTELEEIYREADAWSISTYSHLKSLRRLRDKSQHDAEWKAFLETPEFKAAMVRINHQLPEGTCAVRIAPESPEPRYPSSALFRGMIGTIILKMDVDNEGKAHNARMVAAVPAKHFAETALKNAAKLKFRPVDGSPADCSMAQVDKVITYQFTMR
jgi:TonB family protein